MDAGDGLVDDRVDGGAEDVGGDDAALAVGPVLERAGVVEQEVGAGDAGVRAEQAEVARGVRGRGRERSHADGEAPGLGGVVGGGEIDACGCGELEAAGDPDGRASGGLEGPVAVAAAGLIEDGGAGAFDELEVAHGGDGEDGGGDGSNERGGERRGDVGAGGVADGDLVKRGRGCAEEGLDGTGSGTAGGSEGEPEGGVGDGVAGVRRDLGLVDGGAGGDEGVLAVGGSGVVGGGRGDARAWKVRRGRLRLRGRLRQWVRRVRLRRRRC